MLRISTEVRKRAYGDTFEENKYTEGNYAENELAILQNGTKSLSVKGKALVLRIAYARCIRTFFSLFCQCQLSGHKSYPRYRRI